MQFTKMGLLKTVAYTDYHKVDPIGPLHAEKLAEAVLLKVFKIAFTASRFSLLLINS